MSERAVVVVLEQLYATGRLVDGLPIERHVEAIYSSFEVVDDLMVAVRAVDVHAWPGDFGGYVARGWATDEPDCEDLGCRTYGPDGMLWGDTPTWTDQWRGRSAAQCHFQLRDIVGLVRGDVFRWAIVVMLPMTPAEVAHLGHDVSPDCDTYAVYFADGGHTHAAEGELLRAPRPVPRKTRQGLLAAWRAQQPASPRP